jgi:hypothetical protein
MTRTYLTTREQIVAAAKEAIRTMFDRGIPGYMPADFERAAAFARARHTNAVIRDLECDLAGVLSDVRRRDEESSMLRTSIINRHFAAQREARREQTRALNYIIHGEQVTSRYPSRYPNYMPSRPARGGEL